MEATVKELRSRADVGEVRALQMLAWIRRPDNPNAPYYFISLAWIYDEYVNENNKKIYICVVGAMKKDWDEMLLW